jgi:rod shape determining protein RodA
MLREKSQLRYLDGWILLSAILLCIIGLVAIYSATSSTSSVALQRNFIKQVLWLFLGVMVLAVTLSVPMRLWHRYAYAIYGLTLFLLVVVLLLPKSDAGVHRWIAFGGFRLQPSELAKIGTLLALSRFASRDGLNWQDPRNIALAFLIIGLPMALVAKQPDLGTAMVFGAMVLPMLYWAGLPLFTIFVLTAPVITLVSAFNYYSFLAAMMVIMLVLYLSGRGLKTFLFNFSLNVTVGIFTPLLWNHLRDYQKMRILTFLGLEMDPRGLSYQVIQSKVAIGSGGLWGKGYLQGTQTQLRFLPAQHTDFILSVLGEEFGFIGITLVVFLFLFLILRGIRLAANVRSPFASLLVLGAVTIILFHVLINMGMTVGVAPVTGLPLPFLSYGGSALMTFLAMIGLILNASVRRFQYT